METKQSLILVVLPELMDSDDEKSTRGKTRLWIKRRSVSGYFNNVITELMIKDCKRFKGMFLMNVEDFEFVLKSDSHLPKKLFYLIQ